MRQSSLIVLLLLSTMLAAPAQAQSSNILGDNYNIMVPEKGSKRESPEPWLAPKYKSPRGTVKHVVIPKSTIVSPPKTVVPADVFVPQTGRTFQNLPTVSGSGVGGRETFQDRASRCAHQAGVYGQATGGNYMGACVNQ
jgi:hypothetical protein